MSYCFKISVKSGNYELSHMVHADCQVNEKIQGRLDEGEQEDKFVDEGKAQIRFLNQHL